MNLEEHWQKLKSIRGVFPKELENNKIKNKLNQVKKTEEIINRSDVKYEINKYFSDFLKFQTIRSFGNGNFNSKITISEADKKQSNLMNNIIDFDSKVRPRSKMVSRKKKCLW